MSNEAAEQGSIDEVVSTAVERIIIEHYLHDSEFVPKKNTESNVRNYLDINHGEPCADILLQARSDPRTFKIVEGKGKNLGRLEKQFGYTAAALLVGKEPVTRVYFEVFARIDPVPYQELRSQFPGIEKRDNSGHSQGENARKRLYAEPVSKMLELFSPSGSGPTSIGEGLFAAKSYQSERILIDSSKAPRTPTAILPEFGSLGRLTARAADLSPRKWSVEKFSALAGKFSPHTTVKLVRFKTKA